MNPFVYWPFVLRIRYGHIWFPQMGYIPLCQGVPFVSESEVDIGLGRDNAPVLRGEAGDISFSCALPGFQYF